MTKLGGHRSWGERLIVRVPYLWLAAFFLLPFLIVLKISLSQTAIAQPPYTPVFDPAAGWSGVVAAFSALSFENYALLGSDWIYLASYLKSLEVATGSTLLLLLIGFPIAYGIARAPRGWQPVIFVLIVLPFYATLEKMDQTLLEAAADLGCPNWKAFWLVTLPLSRPGVVAGVLLW